MNDEPDVVVKNGGEVKHIGSRHSGFCRGGKAHKTEIRSAGTGEVLRTVYAPTREGAFAAAVRAVLRLGYNLWMGSKHQTEE